MALVTFGDRPKQLRLASDASEGREEECDRAVVCEPSLEIGAALLAIADARLKLRAAAGDALLLLDALRALDVDTYDEERTKISPLIEIVLHECLWPPWDVRSGGVPSSLSAAK